LAGRGRLAVCGSLILARIPSEILAAFKERARHEDPALGKLALLDNVEDRGGSIVTLKKEKYSQ